MERRNWALEMRSQGTKRVQGGAVVQRMLKSLRGLGLEEKERLPKPWKEVGRKGSSTAANLQSTSTLPGKEKSPEVPLLGNSFFLPDRQATQSVFLSGYVLACVCSSQCVMHLCVCFWICLATECTRVMCVCAHALRDEDHGTQVSDTGAGKPHLQISFPSFSCFQPGESG